jgi:molybdopterin molybdotransferase
MENLLHPDKALEIVLEATRPLEPVTLTLDKALDHVTVEDVRAAEDVPLTDISAMDGFAVRSADVASASASTPVALKVIDYVPAGRTSVKTVGAGECIRIMTGGPLPAGADAVIKQEDTRGADDANATRVEVLTTVPPQGHIFPKGEDIETGDVIVSAGTLLRPQELGVLASVGVWKVKVRPRPRVAVLATGDELVEAHEAIEPGKVRSSNSLTLVNQARRYGASPQDLGIGRDRLDDILGRLRSADAPDVVITSGGSAKGDKDFSEAAMLELGVEVKFHRVAIKPGKPVLFGVHGRTLYFGLPGNPVASMLTFELFVRPALLKMRGLSRLAKRTAEATLQEDVPKKELGKKYYIRMRYQKGADGATVSSTGNQGSSVLSSMTKGNAVLVMDMDQTTLKKGSKVHVWLMDEPEE